MAIPPRGGMDWMLRYYGIDWISTAGTLSSLWLISERRRSGFVLGAAAGIGWCVFAMLTQSMATLFANALVFALNVRGFYSWRTIVVP